MLWSEILFGVKKPIIAMLHLDPLPGDPRFRPNTAMEEIVEHARADLQALLSIGAKERIGRAKSVEADRYAAEYAAIGEEMEAEISAIAEKGGEDA